MLKALAWGNETYCKNFENCANVAIYIWEMDVRGDAKVKRHVIFEIFK